MSRHDQPTILIIGANGQIGQALTETLSRTSMPHIALSRSRLDITQQQAVENTLNNIDFDILVNCAGYTDTEKAETEPDQAYLCNAKALEYIGTACHKHDKPVIHFSTNCIFDGTKSGKYTEADTPNPQSIYGKSKLAGEQTLLKHHDQAYIIRTCWTFSQYPGHNFLLKIIEIAKKQGWLNVVNDQYGCPTAAFRIAELVMYIAKMGDRMPYGIYNYCSTEPTNWYEYTLKIFEHAERFGLTNIPIKPVATGQVPTKVRRPANGVLDCSKIQEVMGVELPDWEEDLETVIQQIMKSLLLSLV